MALNKCKKNKSLVGSIQEGFTKNEAKISTLQDKINYFENRLDKKCVEVDVKMIKVQ